MADVVNLQRLAKRSGVVSGKSFSKGHSRNTPLVESKNFCSNVLAKSASISKSSFAKAGRFEAKP